MKKKMTASIVLLLVFLVLAAAGVIIGENVRVEQNASMICLSCIGLK